MTERGEPLAFFEEAVMRETDECVLWPYGTSKGYGKVRLLGKRVGSYVHRLALERRVGPPPAGKPFALHGPCHQPACFNYRHLRWGTRSENMLDKVRDGTSSRGTSHGQARLTEELVRDIRRRYAAGEPYRKLAAELGIGESTVYHVVNRTSWAWLD